jgi:hypothetical protein
MRRYRTDHDQLHNDHDDQQSRNQRIRRRWRRRRIPE